MDQRLTSKMGQTHCHETQLVKNALLLISLGCLLTACRQTEPHSAASAAELHTTVPAAELRAHIVGSWWFDNYNPDGPFVLFTFSPDGQLSVLHTNSPDKQVRHLYWRVDWDGILIVTKTRDALPGSNDEMFFLDHMTDGEMVFGHPSVAGRMTFKK